MSNEDFLRFNFSNLRGIAIGPASRPKNWLTQFLKSCQETSEKAHLQRLLAIK
jgi:hypothetical protein